MRSRKILISLIILTVLNFLDFATMIHVSKFETNPIFNSYGFLGLIVAKLVFNIAMWYLYYKNNFGREWIAYLFAFYIVWISFILLYFGIFLNVTLDHNPQLISNASARIQTNGSSYYSSVMNFFFIIPAILNLIVFWLHKDNLKYCMIKR
jgi:hypothetical protein